MNEAGTETIMDTIPACDFCNTFEDRLEIEALPATVDGATKMGPWAYMCEAHFGKYGIGLGLGVGQRLILREKP